jgi:hypothetical protein
MRELLDFSSQVVSESCLNSAPVAENTGKIQLGKGYHKQE